MGKTPIRWGLKNKLLQLLTMLGIYENPAFNVALARYKGAKIGEGTAIYRTSLDLNACFLLEVGARCAITGATLLNHDASTGPVTGHSRLGRITIGNDVFIGKGSIILPNVTIGDRVIVGAGSVVTKDIPSGTVAAGNPARVVGSYAAFCEKHKQALKTRPVFAKRPETMDEREREEALLLLSDGHGYCK